LFRYDVRSWVETASVKLLVEGFSLRQRSWKPVKNESVRGVWLIQTISDDGNDQIIGHKVTTLHNFLRVQTCFRA